MTCINSQALSFLTSPESGSGHLEEIQEVLRHIEVQSDVTVTAPVLFFLNVFLRAGFWFFSVYYVFLCSTMVYYVLLL